MQQAASIYNAAYPYMVMTLAFVSAFGSIVGGGVAAVQIAVAPVTNPNDSCAPNVFGAAAMFVVACLLAMGCLWVGGKFSGAF